MVDIKINPVTIPKSFGLKNIPNLIEAFFHLEWSEQSRLERMQDYFMESRKRGKRKEKRKKLKSLEMKKWEEF